MSNAWDNILIGVSECHSATFTEMKWAYQLPSTLGNIIELESRM